MNQNRTSALALFLVILGLELALSGAGQYIWHAMWAGPYPLGKAIYADIRTQGVPG